jgi:hypothetical protein
MPKLQFWGTAYCEDKAPMHVDEPIFIGGSYMGIPAVMQAHNFLFFTTGEA